MRISEVMTRNVAVVAPHASVHEAARKMDQLNVGALPVCDGHRLIGMITDRDITVRSTAAGKSPERTRVADVMSEDVRWCFEDDRIEDAEAIMERVQIRRLPVVDRQRRLIGIVALGDLAADRVPGAGEVLRRISEPSEPDRSGVRILEARSGSSAEAPSRGAARQPQPRPTRAAGQSRGDYERQRSTEGWDSGWWFDDGHTQAMASVRQEDGVGASGADFTEPYQDALTGGDRPLGGPEGANLMRIYDSGRYRSQAYGRSYRPKRFDESYARSGAPRTRSVFDEGQRAGIFEAPGPYRGRGPRGYERPDRRIEEQVNEHLLMDDEIDAREIEVAVKGGEVTLTGTVGSRFEKRHAEDIADAIPGVTHVQNNLRLGATG